MDFYRINEEYNKFLQKYEKDKRGVTKVPNIRYTDRNKFAFGAVMQVNGMNYYVSVSSFDKKQVIMPPKAKITKEMIVDAAFEIVRSEGVDKVTNTGKHLEVRYLHICKIKLLV